MHTFSVLLLFINYCSLEVNEFTVIDNDNETNNWIKEKTQKMYFFVKRI